MISCTFWVTPCMVTVNDRRRILRVPFTASVKLRALLLKAGPGEKTPAKVLLVGKVIDCAREEHNARIQFANENNIDFNEIADRTPTQEFHVPQGREVGEYQVRYISHKARCENQVSPISLGLRNSQTYLPSPSFSRLHKGPKRPASTTSGSWVIGVR